MTAQHSVYQFLETDANRPQYNDSSAQREFLNPPEIHGYATWEWNIPENTVFFSKEWQRILRDSDSSVLGPNTKSWWSRMHQDDVAPFIEIARGLVYGSTEQYQSMFRVRRSDDTWAWLLSKGTVTDRSNGKAMLVRGGMMDISNLREDVKFLHGISYPKSLESLPVLESGPDFSVRMERKFFPLAQSSTIGSLLAGKTPLSSSADEAAIARGNMMQIDYFQQKAEEVFATGVAARERVRFPTLYGHDVIGEFAFWPEMNRNGDVTTVMAQFRDITDQVNAERQAKLTEMRLGALCRLTQLDSADEQSVLHFVMDSMSRLTGSELGFLYFPSTSPEEAPKVFWSDTHLRILHQTGKSRDELLGEYRGILAGVARLKSSRMVQNGNGLHPVQEALDGAIRVMRYFLVPALDNGKTVCVAGCANKEVDYTPEDIQQAEAFINGAWLILRRHELMRELQRAKDAAEQASRVKDVFLANISHELRTPLNGLLSMIQLMDSLPPGERQRSYLHTARESGQTLLRIISDLLDFSCMESGKMSLNIQPFEGKKSIASAMDMFRDEAKKKGLTLSCVMDPQIPRVLLGDEARVRQLIFNLVGNSLKFTPSGGIRVASTRLPNAPAGKIGVLLEVQDTGIGIAKSNLTGIFEAFNQMGSIHRKNYSGTGLGLGIVKHLTRLMGGEVHIESEEGVGTTVRCSVFFGEPSDEGLDAAVEAPAPEHGGMRPLHVLVAEDDTVGSLAMRLFLEKRGHKVVCVDDGFQAIEAMRAYPFDCVFTDITMPLLNGMEMTRNIRAGGMLDIRPSDDVRRKIGEVFPGKENATIPLNAQAPIVAVSAHAMTGDRERFLQAGMDYYISKPLIKEELDAALSAVRAKLAAHAGDAAQPPEQP